MTGTLAWHFVGDTLRDGRPVPADGEVLRHDGPLVMCLSGFHASEKVMDALYYAPGHIVCRVECGGEILHEEDKLLCSERTILWRLDAIEVLRKFARLCALDVAHLWEMPDVVRGFLETGNEATKAAAWAAARDTVEAPAWTAAWAAARDAARAAAWASAAAWDTAEAPAWDTVGAPAWDTAWIAARAAAWDTVGAPAWDTAWIAARAAAWDTVWNTAWITARAAAKAAGWAAQEARLVALIEEARA